VELENENIVSVCPFTYLLNIDIAIFITIIDDDNIVIVTKSKN